VEVRFYWWADGRVTCYVPRKKEYCQEYVSTWRHERLDEALPYRHDPGYYTTRPAIVAVIGCDHDYDSVKLGNCWHGSKCKKCGHYYEVDSGD
jgi:hypothetical protein